MSLEFSGDSNKGRQSALALDLYLFKNTLLYLSGGSSRIVDEDNNEEEKTSTNFNLGVVSDPNALFSGGLEYDFWGLKDDLTVKTLRVPLAIKLKDWRFALTPGSGEVELPTVVILSQPRTFSSEVTSLSYQISYSGLKNWLFKIGGANYEYEENVSALSGPIISLFFSDSTISLASGLLERSFNLGLKYSFTDFDFGFMASQSESAFDNQVYNQGQIDIEYFVNEEWSLMGFLGSTRPEDEDSSSDTAEKTSFLGLGFSYNWL